MQDSFLFWLFIFGLSVFCVFFLLYFNDLIEKRKYKEVFVLKSALISLLFSYAIPSKNIFTTQWITLLFIFFIPFVFYYSKKTKKIFISELRLHIFLVCNCPFLIFLIFALFFNVNSYQIFSTLLTSFSMLLLCFYAIFCCFKSVCINKYSLSYDCLASFWILLNFAILVGAEYVSYGDKIMKYLYQTLHIDAFGLFGMVIFCAVPLHIFLLIFLIKKFKKTISHDA